MGHSEGALVDEFCTQRKASCDKHGEKYRDNCAVSWEYQAHHVLCVASVTQYLSANTTIRPVISKTAWCINTAANMLAMPTYMGRVVRYYDAQLALGDLTPPPPFAEIPVHGYDHNTKKGYKSEIDDQMVKLAKAVEKSKQKHEDEADTLKGRLDAYRDKMKPLLKARGTRGQGTHKEWLRGFSGNPSDKWYLPFSMADDANVEPRTFPAYSKATHDRVKILVQNIL